MNRALVNLLVDTVAAALLTAMVGTGYILWFALPPGTNRTHSLWGLLDQCDPSRRAGGPRRAALALAGRRPEHFRAIAAELDDARLKAWCAMEAEPLFYLGRWNELVRVANEGLPFAWENWRTNRSHDGLLVVRSLVSQARPP